MNKLLERLLIEVQSEWGVGGLDSSTMYGEFAIEVAKRAALAEREACVMICDDISRNGKGGAPTCVRALRERSNARHKPRAVASRF